MTTGERMKKRRKELGISADSIAETLGVSRSTIFRYEKGDIEKLPIDILEPLATILRTTPAYLMGWSDNHNQTNSSQSNDSYKAVIPNVLATNKEDAIIQIAEHNLRSMGMLPENQSISYDEALNFFKSCNMNIDAIPMEEVRKPNERTLSYNTVFNLLQELTDTEIKDIITYIEFIISKRTK